MSSIKNNIVAPEPPEKIPGVEKKRDSFTVPEGYFDNLPGTITDLILRKEIQGVPSRQVTGSKLIRKALIPLLTASVVLVVYLIFRPDNQTSVENLANLHDTLNLNDGYDASYAADALTADYRITEEWLQDEGINDEFDPGTDLYLDEQVDEDAIIEYLSEQDLDNSLLAEL